MLMLAFLTLFAVVHIRLLDLMWGQSERISLSQAKASAHPTGRGKILDREGNIIATTLVTASLYADPNLFLSLDETVQKLTEVFRDLKPDDLRKKLQTNKHFVWIKRNLSPQQQEAVLRLGLPGLDFQYEEKRVYPQGSLFSHILGKTDVDGLGIAGVEKSFEEALKTGDDIQLSLSLPVQYIIYDSLKNGIQKFRAKGGSAIIVDLTTASVLGMVSLPDFDPNGKNPDITAENLFNRNTSGVYELGSIMKMLNTALFLEEGSGGINAVFDATHPLKLGQFKIRDFKGQARPLTVEEIFYFSSNIGSALMALSIGPQKQQEFLRKFGLFEKPELELPEKGRSLYPSQWGKATCITASFGHGFAASPLQFMQAVTNLMIGYKTPLSLKYRSELPESEAPQLISEKNKTIICKLLKRTIEEGTAKKGRVEGYLIGGKTATAEKIENGRYLKDGRNLNSFLGVFPIHKPKYALIITLDQPSAIEGTYGYTTAGWNAAPIGGEAMSRLMPILGLSPEENLVW